MGAAAIGVGVGSKLAPPEYGRGLDRRGRHLGRGRAAVQRGDHRVDARERLPICHAVRPDVRVGRDDALVVCGHELVQRHRALIALGHVDEERTLGGGACVGPRLGRRAAAIDDDRRAALTALDLDGLALDLLVRDRVLRLARLAGDLHVGRLEPSVPRNLQESLFVSDGRTDRLGLTLGPQFRTSWQGVSHAAGPSARGPSLGAGRSIFNGAASGPVCPTLASVGSVAGRVLRGGVLVVVHAVVVEVAPRRREAGHARRAVAREGGREEGDGHRLEAEVRLADRERRGEPRERGRRGALRNGGENTRWPCAS